MKKVLVVLLVVILLAGCAAGGYWWYRHTHVFIDEAVYRADAQQLDLRGQDISFDHYEAVCRELPGCQVLWDVPFQGRKVSSDSRSIAITTLEEKDIPLLAYFPRLKAIDASGCADYAMLELLRDAWPELEVSYTVDLGGVAFAPDVTELTLTEGSYDYDTMMLNLVHLPQVRTITLPNTTLPLEKLREISQLYGGVEVEYTVCFRGQETDPAITELNLSDLTPEEVDQVAAELAFFPDLQWVELMDESGKSRLSLTDVQKLQEAAPGATVHYTYTFYGQTLSTTDTEVEYRYKYMKDSDEAEIRQILDVMDSCERFVFNGCHISNEVMARIREDYRGKIKIVWRVYFGNGGSCLTDREVIKMVYGLTNSNSQSLRYCEDARYIDFGHNETLTDISFVAYMPNLEAIILSGSPIKDLSPFAGNKSLYFLEIAYCSYIEDLSPLKDCTNLGMLNVSWTSVTDLSAVDGLPLERLTFTHTKVSDEEIERYAGVNPDCWLTYGDRNEYGVGWRYDEDGSQSEYYKKIAGADIFNYAHASDTQW